MVFDTFSNTQILFRPDTYRNTTCCFSDTALLFGSDIICFRSFWSVMHPVPSSLFPITSWEIFMSLKPSAKACQPVG